MFIKRPNGKFLYLLFSFSNSTYLTPSSKLSSRCLPEEAPFSLYSHVSAINQFIVQFHTETNSCFSATFCISSSASLH